MKKAVIATGGKQYLVEEGETLKVELLKQADKTVQFVPLLVVDGDKINVGKPSVNDSKVTAEIVEQEKLSDKVSSIRYKPKKRVRKVRGHRQRHTIIKIKKI